MNQTLSITEIKKALTEALEQVINHEYPNEAYGAIELLNPKEEKFGDIATNIALKLCKLIKKSPQEVAENIIKKIQLPEPIQKADFAHPGFINFTIKTDYLTSQIDALVSQQTVSLNLHDETVIVEFSQPNVAKPLGVHHLLSTIIGQSIYNIYKKLGYNAVGINYIGDWGTQFGKLMYAYKNWGDKETIEKDPIPELLKLYVKFHDEAEKNPELEDGGRAEFKKLEDGDPENQQLLKWITDESLKDVQKTYDLLGNIHFDLIQGEAFYKDFMQPIVDEGIKKGIFTKGENDALIVEFEDEKLPTCLVQKSDGASLYFTRDMAVIRYRTDHWKPKKLIYVIDIAQSLYMKQVYETARMLWGADTLPELMHVEFGRMRFPEGKMSTRKGTVILLNDLLLEAISRAKNIVQEKNPDLSDEEIEKIAHIVGTGAVKYSVLSQNRQTNVVFTWDKMLSLDGNSAPYLQYAYARARSILRKTETTYQGKEITLNNDEEIALTRKLMRFEEIVERAAEEYRPNTIAQYLFEVTQSFHHFYTKHQVIGSEEEVSRLNLVDATTVVLKEGLSLLGIDVVERM